MARVVEIHPDGLVVNGHQVTGLSVDESTVKAGPDNPDPDEIIVELRITIRATAVTVHSEYLGEPPMPIPDFI